MALRKLVGSFFGGNFAAKSFISHTYTPDRCKSFISTHITNDPGGGGYRIFGVEEFRARAAGTGGAGKSQVGRTRATR